MLSFRSENKDHHLESVLKTRGLSRIPAKFEIEFVLTIDHNFQSSFKQCPSYMYRDLRSASANMKTFKACDSICFNWRVLLFSEVCWFIHMKVQKFVFFFLQITINIIYSRNTSYLKFFIGYRIHFNLVRIQLWSDL